MSAADSHNTPSRFYFGSGPRGLLETAIRLRDGWHRELDSATPPFLEECAVPDPTTWATLSEEERGRFVKAAEECALHRKLHEECKELLFESVKFLTKFQADHLHLASASLNLIREIELIADGFHELTEGELHSINDKMEVLFDNVRFIATTWYKRIEPESGQLDGSKGPSAKLDSKTLNRLLKGMLSRSKKPISCRDAAERLGCSAPFIITLDAWKNRSDLHRSPSGRRPRARTLTPALSETLTESPEEAGELERLIAEHKADSELSPLESGRRRVRVHKTV